MLLTLLVMWLVESSQSLHVLGFLPKHVGHLGGADLLAARKDVRSCVVPTAGVSNYSPYACCNRNRLKYRRFIPVQDLPGALDDAAVAEGLGLSEIKNRDWAIFKTSAVKGDGLFEGTKAVHSTCVYLTKNSSCGLLLPCIPASGHRVCGAHTVHLRLDVSSIVGLDWLTTSLKGQ